MNAIDSEGMKKNDQPLRKRTMRSLTPKLLLKSVAAAGICVAAPAFGQVSGLQANRLGTPDDGMICRPGYTGTLSGSSFKCSKTRVVQVSMHCSDPKISNYVVRAAGAWGSAAGIDICTRNNVNVGSTDSVQGLVLGQDYAYATVNSAEVTAATARADEAEATALGLAANEVDTLAGTPKVIPSAKGSKDMADVTLTHYTFAIPTGGAITALRN